MKSETTKEITKAIIAVMESVKGIDKSMTVGSGANSYKGVPDKEVKKIIGEQMAKNGLAIIPTSVKPKIKIDRWEETWNGQPKQKQAVFTEVETTYTLFHVSGEWIELAGYGHGTDSQDKSAGKATTYALKYALLYLFVVPTGTIDDTDSGHSDTLPIPPQPAKAATLPLISDIQFEKLVNRINAGDKEAAEKAKNAFEFTPEQWKVINKS